MTYGLAGARPMSKCSAVGPDMGACDLLCRLSAMSRATVAVDLKWELSTYANVEFEVDRAICGDSGKPDTL